MKRTRIIFKKEIQSSRPQPAITSPFLCETKWVRSFVFVKRPEGKMNRQFDSDEHVCFRALQNHANELDLADYIDPSKRDEQPYHSVIQVRRWHTDQTMPYNTDYFLKWYANQRIDPQNRQPLDHLKNLVFHKKTCWKLYSDVMTKDVTQDFLEGIARMWLHDQNDMEMESKFLSFVDLHTLQSIGVIHDADLVRCRDLLSAEPAGSWLIRHTTAQWEMPNCQVFTISQKLDEDSLVHHRYLDVHGAGVYEWNSAEKPKKFKDMFPGAVYPPDPSKPTAMHVIAYFVQQLGVNTLVRVRVLG
jgi:hypothetical protein